MDTNALKKFAQAARRDLLAQVEARLVQVLSTDSVELREKLGVVNELRHQVQQKGEAYLVEEVAYTWFNRLCALRYMDVNQITTVGVVSPIAGFTQPEILQEAKRGIFDPELRVDRAQVKGLLDGVIPAGNPEQEAYRLLLVAVCNRYAEEMDFLFPKIEDYTELLMPEDLLSTQSVLYATREALTEDACRDVEVIGWLYQFYISEKKDQVMGQKGAVSKEDIPAVTQLFTPHWIVRYMVENSLGKLWLLNHPGSKIREMMEFYIDPELSPTESSRPSGEGRGEGRTRGGEGQNENVARQRIKLDDEFLRRCRDLRKNATDAEQLLWSFLRNRNLGGYKFRRQHPIQNYILDFYCHESKLCVELDGGGHTEPDQQTYDARRTDFLEAQGIKVLRYWNHEVMTDLEVVLEDILENCQIRSPHLDPLPLGEEGNQDNSLSSWEKGEGSLIEGRDTPLSKHESGRYEGTIISHQGNRDPLSQWERGRGEGSFLKVASPEELKILDPACGSGHILTYAFDLLYAIYEEMGYDPVSIPQLILEKNLYGIEIDKRAAMLSSFALMMKAVEKDKRFFTRDIQPNILEMEDISFEGQEIKDYMAKVGEDLWTQDLWEGLQQFENAKTFGSLIRPALKDVRELRERLNAKGVFEDLFLANTNEKVHKVLEMSEYLSPHYHVVVANPPYFSKGMDSNLKQFVQVHFPDSKADAFAMFIEQNLGLTKPGGYVGMITLMSWMFLTSFEKLRTRLLEDETILTMAHLGARAFDTIGGEVVSTTMFVLKNQKNELHEGTYIRLVDGNSEKEKISAIEEAIDNPNCGWFFRANAADFKKIPGAPIAYWVSDQIIEVFAKGVLLENLANAKQGLATADNAQFLRLWHEVSFNKCGFDYSERETANNSGNKWFPYNKGGSFRRWYGNQDYVVNWENDGIDLLNFSRSVLRNKQYYFRESASWSKVTSGDFCLRFFPPGFIFDVAGCSIFAKNHDFLISLIGAMNSPVMDNTISAISPTLNYEVGQISAFPILPDLVEGLGKEKVDELIDLSKQDWDSFEASWNFSENPLVHQFLITQNRSLETNYYDVNHQWQDKTKYMKGLEEDNNQLFITAYGLENELDNFVPLEKISITNNPYYRYSGNYSEADLEKRLLEDTMKEFISYAVGCTFGRYSLDKPGLILANQGETVEDYYKAIHHPSALTPNPSPSGRGESGGRAVGKVTFPPTETNVIPIVEGEWFPDGAVARFKQFLRVTFGEENFAENLRFIEDALGKDIEKYFTRDFYKDHVKMYKKRPIYWLFSSPQGSFNALIYMHRYNRDTVSVVLNEYLREFREKLSAHHRHLQMISESDNISAREKNQALKESEKVAATLVELTNYEDDVLFPLASQRIEIDLDDGVVVNYAKFGEALKKI